MNEKKSLAEMMAEASAEINRISAEDAVTLYDNGDAIWIDIRDVRELWRDGMIPDAVHAPRGMLEFWVDEDSPYHRDVFSSDKQFVLY